ncbi:sensor domain-containing diguanylate cyclase [Burkholderia pseudomultivorans]|uniref:diguanylate cyclase n=1 Tax=Burkholderia pseudomultivorans TaxID=1207504 RepID=A0A6P2HV96_9BURK|nr:sensor domain-containing diguanylate cyclase [Burkholderia pseudomultivorans]MDR8730992.1 Phytochrome-like protein cph2 [Burkholderia pseudomultivorans]MDR8734357.1 Phytochrome-like protein cph2 [Burkholderia pseudomultivorans]MDR8742327.1 Phytochrome-like protein cph2 [Burkholderia pseudomultivorans]MDR8753574.1 Phytochrome-like protein cph2 [Burkholderia pseudomultivorans]MDR8775675.1 Phytochrome-like protein cph2 [Burkholderia pseudomultivorans]
MKSHPLLAALRRHTASVVARILSPRGVLAAGIVLLLFSWGLSASLLIDARRDAYEHAVENARNLMLLIERDIARNIELYDLSLQNVVDGMADPELMALPPRQRHRLLFDRAATGAYLGSIFVMDPHGNIVVDSGASPARHGNYADRDYFTAHRDRRVQGLYISRPYASRLRGGALTIALSRRIDRPDGTFGGIVVGTLSIDYFRALLDGLAVGPHGTAAIVEENGTLVSRLPYDARVVGLDLHDSPLFIESRRSRDGVLTGTGAIDGVRRIYVYRQLAGLPLIVDVAPAEVDVYASWRHRTISIVVLMSLFTGFIAWGSLLLSRELQRRQRAESKLYRLAHTDALTGLDNRGTFDTVLANEARRAARGGRPLSVLFVDVDHFKAFNDYYGHLAGDDVLRRVAQCASRCLRRDSDQIARYGGEEFVVTLPDTDARGAATVAEAIRRAIAALDIEHAKSPHGRVTASIGTATADDGRIPPATLLRLADDALYRAKSGGRNRVADAERSAADA